MDDKDYKEWGRDHGEKIKNLSVIGADALVEVAEKVGGFLAKPGKDNPNAKAIGLKLNQIRPFLSAVRRIEAEIKSTSFERVKDSIILLRPKLAYAAGRQDKVKPLMNVLDPAVQSAVGKEENFKKFVNLIEAIISYHRYYNGED